jgi:PBSX family phage terminase large subunit
MNLDSLPLSRKQAVSIVEAMGTPQIALWTGAVAAGKTIASLLAFLIAVAEAPDSGLIVMVGWTLQSIERNLLDPLQDERLFGEFAGQVHHTTGSTVATILDRTVHLIGAADSRAEARIRGSSIALGYIDEVTLIPESFWVMMLSRLRVPNARLFGTSNPANPSHWLRRDYILRAGEVGMRHWHFTLDDNPGLAPGFVDRLKRQYTGLFYKRFIEGRWIAAEGVVYDMWDPDLHVVDIMPPMARWIGLGVDHGTVAPFAALLLGLGVNNKLYLAAEWRYDSRQAHQQLTDSQYSERLRNWLLTVPIPASQLRGVRPEFVVVDPAAAGFRRQLHVDGMSPVLADNSVLPGIMLMSSLLGRGDLLVHRSCTGWIDEVGGYSWDDRAAQMGEDKPVKADDHSLDASRYITVTSKALWQQSVPLTTPVPNPQDVWGMAG